MSISAILSLMQCPLFLSLGAFALFASGFAGAGEAISDNPGSERKIPEDRWRGAWSFQVENDKIANTDRHYTNGVRFLGFGPPERWADWTRKLLEKFYPLPVRKAPGRDLPLVTTSTRPRIRMRPPLSRMIVPMPVDMCGTSSTRRS